jgi:hypothetical protein
VQALLAAGSDVRALDHSQRTPLHYASRSENPETIQILLDHGADVSAKDKNHHTPEN